MKKRALILSCGNYTNSGLRPLPSFRPDAERIDGLLANTKIGQFETQLLLDPNLVEAQSAIYEILNSCSHSDLIILYLSGHGLKDAFNRFYFAVPDTDPSRLPATALSGRYIREQIADTSTKRLIVILDTCYAGAFGQEMLAKAHNSLMRVPDELTGGEGHVVMAASSPLQLSFESGEAEVASVFTKALCEGIETGQADFDGDGLIGLGELFEFAARAVADSHPAQTPQISYFGVTADLILARAPRIPTATELDPDIISALESIHPQLRIGAINVLTSYMKSQDPDRRAAAKNRLRTIQDDPHPSVQKAVAKALRTPPPNRRPRTQIKTIEDRRLQNKETINIPARELVSAAQYMPGFASADPSLPILQSVFIRSDGKDLELQVTDRYRAERRKIVGSAGQESFEALVFASDLGGIRGIGRRGDAQITTDSTSVEIAVGSKFASLPTVEGGFPNISALFQGHFNPIEVNASDLLSAVVQVMDRSNIPRNSPVGLRFPSRLHPELRVYSSEIPEVSANVAVCGNCNGEDVLLNPHFVEQALRSLGDESIEILSNSRTILMIVNHADVTREHLIMSIRKPPRQHG